MARKVKTSTPPGVMKPIGPYSHIAESGDFITISATAGVDPATGELAGPDVASQTRQILSSFELMLASIDSDFAHVLHINVFLKNMDDFTEMNKTYAAYLGTHRPARTCIAVTGLPKPGARVTMNLTAVHNN